jgi:hypothetical protein
MGLVVRRVRRVDRPVGPIASAPGLHPWSSTSRGAGPWAPEVARQRAVAGRRHGTAWHSVWPRAEAVGVVPSGSRAGRRRRQPRRRADAGAAGSTGRVAWEQAAGEPMVGCPLRKCNRRAAVAAEEPSLFPRKAELAVVGPRRAEVGPSEGLSRVASSRLGAAYDPRAARRRLADSRSLRAEPGEAEHLETARRRLQQ